MKNTLLAIALLLCGSSMAQEKIQWMSIEEAYELTQTEDNPKKDLHRRLYRLVRLVQAHG